ncbi:hypothetical protein [Streptomyces sp. NPDC047070]|uniref:hypothetical protein n=1 Tax=Streptomyces sp. NPDC047070 TaxID=3154923 RepID=UPI00345331B1
MPWEELDTALKGLRVTRTEPFWVVPCGQDSFSAHPAFLDSHRVTGALAAMLGGEAEPLKRNRVVTDGQLKRDMPTVYKALGPHALKYTNVSDCIRLLRHWQAVEGTGVILGAPEIVHEASVFAVQQGSATCADFVHAQAAYLAVGQSLQAGKYVVAAHQSELLRRYNLALAAAGEAQPLGIGDESVWATHSVPFVEAVQKQAAQLTFGSLQAIVGHAFKHLRRNEEKLTGELDGQRIHDLVDGYLTEARKRITKTDAGTVTSALDQCAGSRTYYFGGEGEVTMVAVSPTGLTWISTYYAPHRF